MASNFVHLHTHSYFSLLKGLASPDALAEGASRLGQRAIALTDDNNMFGAIRFARAARRNGIRPIYGLQLAVGPNSRPVTLLAHTEPGYRNLLTLATAVRTERSPNKLRDEMRSDGSGRRTALPRQRGGSTGSAYRDDGRVDVEFLFEHGDGLIVLSGGPAGQLAALLAADLREEAEQMATSWRERFGPDNYYVELQDHGLPGQERLNGQLVALANSVRLPVVATNDVRYVDETDGGAHAALLAMAAGTTLSDPDRPTLGSAQHYLASAAVMQERFAHLPEAITNTVAIAERCDVTIATGGVRLPQIAAGGADGAARSLAEVAYDGAGRRFGTSLSEAVTQRLQLELDIIGGRALAPYFLIVADVVAEAKRRGIPVGPGRGSAAASLVAYCLGITAVDPLEHGLIFERFLNPERVGMPDIDIDVADDRRDELLQYVRERFGPETVAQIVTFGTLAARAAVREAGNVLDVPRPHVEALLRHVPSGGTFADAEAVVGRREATSDAERDMQRVLRLAKQVEGVPRHVSVHAAGVVIGDGPLHESVPLLVTREGRRITQYPMDDVEALGFLKLDLLGLRTLSVIQRARAYVDAGGERSVTSGTLEDEAVYESVRRTGTEGIFQLETPMFQNLVRRLQPAAFADFVALLALGRPGPMQRVEQFIRRRHGHEPVRYIHKQLEPILKETYGFIVYQEQVMHIAMRVAGYSAAEADLLRRMLTERGERLPDEERQRFVDAARANGFADGDIDRIWDELVQFAGYGFAKSHSVAYALLTYETARLRTHFPGPFWAALLTSAMDNPGRLQRYVGAARAAGTKVLGPNVNESAVEFEPMEKERAVVVFGLAGLRHMGRGVAEAIVQARGDSPFQSLADFCRRLPEAYRRKPVLRALIEAGACDGFGQSRAHMLEEAKKLTSAGGAFARTGSLFEVHKKRKVPQQTNLSDMIDEDEPRFVLTLAPGGERHMQSLHSLLAAHAGPIRVMIKVPTAAGFVTVTAARHLSVDGGPALQKQWRQWIAAGRLTEVRRLP